MNISLTRFTWSMWNGRRKEKEPVSKASAMNSSPSSEWGVAKETNKAPPQRKVRRREEGRKVDKEFDDAVLVLSDDGFGSDWYLSGSESDDSDWSIGWLEPLGSDFKSGDDAGFAVLVPCYSPSCKEVEVEASNKALLGAINSLSNEYSSACKTYMEQWLAGISSEF